MRERHQRQLKSSGPESNDEIESDSVVSELAEQDPGENLAVAEAKEPKESANTVAELLAIWAEEYETSDNEAEKRELSYKILKVEMALNISKLDAGRIKIRKADDGTLGLYTPETGETAITTEGLELPPNHFADIFVHEAGHAGKLTGGRRLMDEGVAETLTLLKLGGAAMQDIYVKERQRLEDVFGAENIRSVIKKYDYDAPRKLATWYLETELKDQWNKIKGKLPDKQPETSAAQDKALRKAMVGVGKSIENQFEKGVPDLYGRLKQENFDFKGNELKILRRLYKD